MMLDIMDELWLLVLSQRRMCTIKPTSEIKSTHPKWWRMRQLEFLHSEQVCRYGQMNFLFLYTTVLWKHMMIEIIDELWRLVSSQLRICTIKTTSDIKITRPKLWRMRQPPFFYSEQVCRYGQKKFSLYSDQVYIKRLSVEDVFWGAVDILC